MKISGLISHINKHLKFFPLVELAQVPELLEEQTQKIKEAIEALPSSRSCGRTFQGSLAPTGYAEIKLIDEPFIVGQQETFSVLKNLVIKDAEAKKIGMLGKGGFRKTLILKKLFNRKKVRNYFSDGLLLWLIVSQNPSVKSLRYEVHAQIELQKGAYLGEKLDEEGVKLLLNRKLQQSQSFAIFFDDVWGEDAAELLEKLGVQRLVREHSQSKIIFSSQDRSGLLKMGIADKYIIIMEDLIEEDSWKLFSFHAFPYNNEILHGNIDEDVAKHVCHKCGGLPIAIKVVGREMGSSTLQGQWEWALNNLPNTDSINDFLRLSYDALGNKDLNMQLCFLYMATCCLKGQVLYGESIIHSWLGEGLLARKVLQDKHQLSYDPFKMGNIYLNILADSCLIEPIVRDFEGQEVFFRVHDVLQDLATEVVEEEESFYCCGGIDLTELNEYEISECSQIFLSRNKFSSLPESFRAPQVHSLLMMFNKYFTIIPKRVMGSVVSLKVLNLSDTSLKSFPDSVGCLKQLVCMDLSDTPIKSLPESLTNLLNLEILNLDGSSITKLPYGLHKLASLKFLDLLFCKYLQYVPCSISKMTSLQSLWMTKCDSFWTKPVGYGRKRVACIENLASLKQLKKLFMQNNGKLFSEGTLESMIEMETLSLVLTEMEKLPSDLSKVSKLRRLQLTWCSHLVKMGSNFCDLQNLRYLQLYGCTNLEELPQLQTLRSLRKFSIYVLKY